MQHSKFYNIYIYATSSSNNMMLLCRTLVLKINMLLFLNHKFVNKKSFTKPLCFFVFFVSLCFNVKAQRADVLINDNWQSKLLHSKTWETVNVPHNWDQYYGYRRMVHGNLHDTALYKKEIFIAKKEKQKRYLLQFEGVGSYATVLVNNEYVGDHKGGRTSFTLDITNDIKIGKNLIEVQAAHPAHINDLPWVCGGCSDERGFSEGSQPLGIFRNVHLITVNDIYIPPFGVHGWSSLNGNKGTFFSKVRFNNPNANFKPLTVEQLIIENGTKKIINKISKTFVTIVNGSFPMLEMQVSNLKLWSLKNPYLYKIVTRLKQDEKIIDEQNIDFGFRTIRWAADKSKLFINDEQVFVNGIAEYEHLIGNSHSFSDAQINSRIKWITNAGFNAFRDAHQPHNLLYGKLLNQKGMLWWSQFSAHIWYDTEEFKTNFKKLLEEWILERRNDPALFMWGLQNESKLPKEFTEECAAIIRELDPTASTQRLITTCNGGSGADWDVPQNWSGTYGGDVNNYGNELKKQKLVGEFGAWRTLGLHSDDLNAEGHTEEKACNIIETKIRKANEVKDSVVGHFFWLFNSHENPGRVQSGEGVREMDRVGPINYKGLLTAWEEPTDLYYLFQSNYADKNKNPMVYIVSHTWPAQFSIPQKNKIIKVYSNCDVVELHDIKNKISYGQIKNEGIGYHFEWELGDSANGVYAAYGYVNGKKVTADTLPTFDNYISSIVYTEKSFIIKNLFIKDYEPYLKYDFGGGSSNLYEFTNTDFITDRAFEKDTDSIGTTSWTNQFKELPSFYASQGNGYSFIKENVMNNFLNTFRYGQNKLKFHCNMPNGKYKVQLFFIEPWIGVVQKINGSGMRLFDVAINGKTVIENLDIWKEANGANKLLIKTINVTIVNQKFELSFPNIKAGQAIISALTILKPKAVITKPFMLKNNSIIDVPSTASGFAMQWLSINDNPFTMEDASVLNLPAPLYGATYLSRLASNETVQFKLKKNSNVYVAANALAQNLFYKDWNKINEKMVVNVKGSVANFSVYQKYFEKNKLIHLPLDTFDIIAIVPASNMQPAFDLKPIKQYKANVAFITDNVIKDSIQNRICAIAQNNESATISFPIDIGAADIYSFTTKYYYELEQKLPATMQIKDANGVVYLNEQVNFINTKKGKWNQFTVNTNSMINAGKYYVTYFINNAKQLAINGIDVQ